MAYGGENGFSQAIELASESLLNVRYVAERKLLSKLFEEIDKDTGKLSACFFPLLLLLLRSWRGVFLKGTVTVFEMSLLPSIKEQLKL